MGRLAKVNNHKPLRSQAQQHASKDRECMYAERELGMFSVTDIDSCSDRLRQAVYVQIH